MEAFRRLSEIVAASGSAALVTVHAVEGSAPRGEGARMVVRADGAFHGTIGGGELEWRLIAEAREALAAGPGVAHFLTRTLGPDLGQCCGGRVRLLLETFDARDTADIAALAAAEAEGIPEVTCRLADGRVRRTVPPPFASPRERGEGFGRKAETGEAKGSEGEGTAPDAAPPSSTPPHPRLPTGGLLPSAALSPQAERGERAAFPLEPPWREPLGGGETPLLLFGAGHVGRALVLALAPLPFAVRWIDGRADAFPAHVPANAAIVRSADPAAELGRAPEDAFVVVMTHSHPLDLAITATALKLRFPFVGLIGSATKRARFEARYRALGVPAARIGALACPIGVPGIEGKEPAVIAAATVAQLLQVREKAALHRSPPQSRHSA